MNAYSNMRAHHTPIPTPPIVRVGASALVALSIAAAWSSASMVMAFLIAALAAGAAVALTLLHPYRARMRAYADTVLNIAQIIPLMLWWALIMLAPVINFPWWATGVTALLAFGAAHWLFPHVDGTRKLAFA